MARLAIILTDGFADWEYAMIGGTGGPFYGLEVAYFAPDAGALTSQGGLRVQVAQSLDRIPDCRPDAVVVVGGTIWETGEAPDIGDLLAGQREAGAAVAGICGGTLALARAGLLDDVAHTSNDPGFLTRNAPGYRGAQPYRESASAVSDGRTVTAPGTAPVSFAAAVFEAVGLGGNAVGQFRAMLAAEHA